MKKTSEDRGMLSRLPGERRYWVDLTDRIVAEASPDLEARRGQGLEWWSAMSRFSTVLATGAVAAVIAAISFLPAPVVAPAASVEPITDAFGIAPDHSFATPLLMAESPPSMEALVLSGTELDR